MFSPRLVPSLIAASAALALLAIATGGCAQDQPPLLAALQKTWTTSDASGAAEKVAFDADQVSFGVQGDRAYGCPYAIRSFHEERNVIEMKMRCKRRIGVDAWVNYRLEFTPDRQKFAMLVEGRTAGVFTLD